MKLEFGIPKQRQKREDKYEGQAVLIMLPKPEETGSSYRFEFSKTALEKLQFKDILPGSVAFSFTPEGEVIIANVSGFEVPDMMNVTKRGTFSSKPIHEYLTKKLNLDPSQENIFNIQGITGAGEGSNFISFGKLKLNSEVTEEDEVSNNELDESLEPNDDVNTTEEQPTVVEDSQQEERELSEQPANWNQ